jgi:hypothetical protein
MPQINQMPAAPQPAQTDLQLPPDFPEIPDSVIARFPELKDWKDAVSAWYDALGQALQDAQQSTATLVNQLQAQVNTLQTEVDDIAPGAYSAGAVAATGTVSGVDGTGTAREYLVK